MQKSTLTLFKSLAFSFFFFFNASLVQALDYYWVGGSGNWSDYAAHWAKTSGGTQFHDQVPQSIDNVYFDANSFSSNGQIITVDETIIYCKNMDWTGAISGSKLTNTGGRSNKLYVYGSFTLNSDMNYDFNGEVHFLGVTPNNGSPPINIVNEIRMKGIKFRNNVIFDGDGTIEYKMKDAFTIDVNDDNSLILKGGIIKTDGNDLNVGWGFSMQVQQFSYSTKLKFYLGNSLVKIPGRYGLYGSVITLPLNPNLYTELVFDAGTSTIEMGLPATKDIDVNEINALGYTFHNVIFHKRAFIAGCVFNNVQFLHDGNIDNNNTFNSVTFSPKYQYAIRGNTTQTIINSLNISGNCGGYVFVKSLNEGLKYNLSKTGAAVIAERLIISDCNATGGAQFTANNSVDIKNNAGWLFSTPQSRNLYWIGGSGNYNDPAHWASNLLPNGGECIPTPSDDITFDDRAGFSTGNNTVTLNNSFGTCHSMYWKDNVSSMPIFNGNGGYGGYGNAFYIYGSLDLTQNMQWEYLGAVKFKAADLGNTIKMAGQFFKDYVYFDGVGGGWKLKDKFSVANFVHLDAGSLETDDNNVDIGIYLILKEVNTSLKLGNSIVNINRTSNYDGILIIPSGATFDAGTSTIIFGSQTQNTAIGHIKASNQTFYNVIFHYTGYITEGANNTIHHATFYNNGSIFGSNTFDILDFSPGKVYKIKENTTQTITANGSLNISGTCGNNVFIQSFKDGSKYTFSKSGAAVNVDRVILSDNIATGGASFNATNSINLNSSNTGWAFSTAPRTLYWIEGSGNYNDPAHWSLSSGEAGGECAPTSVDNIIFNSLSFRSNNDIITLNDAYGTCHNMTWEDNITQNPTFKGGIYPLSDQLMIYGSLHLTTNMKWEYNGKIRFKTLGTDVNNIKSAGHSLYSNYVWFDGQGGWKLEDALNIPLEMRVVNGILNTMNYDLNIGAYLFVDLGSSNLLLGNSIVKFFLSQNHAFETTSPYNNLLFDAQNSTIIFGDPSITPSPSNESQILVNHGKFNKVIFNQKGLVFGTDFRFENLEFKDDGRIYGNNKYNTLTFAVGHYYDFKEGTKHIFDANGEFKADGVNNFPIAIRSMDLNSQVTLEKDGKKVCLHFVRLTGMKASGTAFAYAENSDNVANNTGWIFQDCPCITNPVTIVPILDASSITHVAVSGQQALLIVQNLPQGHNVVWYDATQTIELYHSAANSFQPVITQNTTFYVGIKDMTTGCISPLTKVDVYDAYPKPKGVVSGGGIVACNSTANPVIITFTGTAPFNFVYTDGSNNTTVSGYANNLYTINNPSAGTYTLVSLTDAYETALPTDLTGSATIAFSDVILYVDASITTSGNGSNWATAFKTLDEALYVAWQEPCVARINVAQGTYMPTKKPYNMGVDKKGTEMTTSNNRDVSFHVRPGLELYGGYNSSNGTRDINANITTLSGDIDNNGDDDAYHVVLIDRSSNWTYPNDVTKVDGFNVKGGNATTNAYITVNGTFVEHTRGGGIYTLNGLNELNNNKIFDNKAIGGAGIYTTDGVNTVNSNMFYNNNATLQGGAILLDAGNNKVINNLIHHNISTYGAGICTANGINTINNNTISYNSAQNNTVYARGGGIYIDQNSLDYLNNNLFWGNTKDGVTNSIGSDYEHYYNVNNQPIGIFVNNLLQLASVNNYADVSSSNSNGLSTGSMGNLFNQDPKFVSVANNNFYLQSTSPCINAGVLGSDIPTIDINGTARVGNPDIGAYELNCSPPTVSAGSDVVLSCSNTSIILTATGGVSYVWSNGEISSSTTVSPTQTTTYTVTVTSALGCTAMDDVIVNVNSCYPRFNAKVFLNNVDVNTLLMDNYLSTLPNFPTSDPYSAAPLSNNFVHVNNSSVATINPILLATTGSNAIIDWIFIELRTIPSGGTITVPQYTKSVLLRVDGMLINSDGTNLISFTNAPSGSYYVTIRHRNHLGFRTTNPIVLDKTIPMLDFSNNSVPLYGISPLVSLTPNVYTMTSGDANSDGSIDAFDSIEWEIQNGLFDDYQNNADYNLDGSVDAIDSIIWEFNNGIFQELD